MNRRRIALVAVAAAACCAAPATAWGQGAPAPAEGAPATVPSGEANRADALFAEAKSLRDAGNYAEACPKFAASRALANGVGVTLYLADCYEKVGKTQSAWSEFRNAEKLAGEKGDKRAEVAAARAQALEPKLNRVTLAFPLAAGQAAPAVTVDGAAVPPEQLNAPLAVDPGEHEVRITAPGGSTRVLAVHVDPSVPSLVVPLVEPDAVVAPPAAESPTNATPQPGPSSDPGAVRRWAGFGLVAAGAGAAAVGTWLLTSKVVGTMADGDPCDREFRPDAKPAAAVLFSVAGVAAITGVVLVVSAAHKTTEVALTPLALPGGGGAFLHGTF